MDNVKDKNPKADNGWTPLHEAAKSGHEDICRMIIDVVDEKDSKTVNGNSPLDLALRKGHENICNLFLDNI